MDDPRAFAAMLDPVGSGRRDDDDLMAERSHRAQLLLDIGFHAAAFGGVEGADIDDLHGASRGRMDRPRR